MVVMLICGGLILVGLAAVVSWGGLGVEAPAGEGEPDDSVPPRLVASRFLWYLTVGVVSGLGSGVLMAGAGGRLAMRLLAATAGDTAQGRVTEAEQVVGKVSTGGSIGFILFTGLFFGVATGFLFLLIRRWLPVGRLGGLVFGILLLVVAAPRIDPLRADNPDFGIVGPGWVAVVVFSAVVLVHGMLVAALAGRYSSALPPASMRRRVLLAYAPLLLMAPAAPVLVIAAVVGLLTVGLSRVRPVVDVIRSHTTATIGRIALAVMVVVTLPGFVSAVTDIVGSD